MKHILRLTLALALSVTSTAFAQAPASLAGTVFDEVVVAVSTRSSWARITELHWDGRAVVLKSSRGSAFTPSAAYQLFVTAPATGLTYRYSATGKSTATLVFTDSAGETTYTLLFSSPTSGSIESGIHIPSGGTSADARGLGFSGTTASFSISERTALEVAPVLNVSLRGTVAPNRPLIAGFVVPGGDPRDVLIRAVGPSLTSFGVSDVWNDPDFDLFQGGTRVPRRDTHYRDWSSNTPFDRGVAESPSAAFRYVFSQLGAFPLLPDSKDAAALVRLAPGAYTIVADPPAGDSGGAVLIEVYFFP